jgi:hypothetical protein
MEFYRGLPPWARGAVIVGGTALILYIAFRSYNTWKNKQDEQKYNQAAQQADAELKQLAVSGVGPSYSPTQFELFAEKIVQAINGCVTNTNDIESVFSSMKNKADVLQLIKTFGVRYVQPCAATQPISYVRSIFNSEAFGGPLETFLTYGLSASEISKINGILAKNKIDFKF